MRVTCDVTPHHLALAEDVVATFDTRFKMNPPLRSREDVEAILEGLADAPLKVEVVARPDFGILLLGVDLVTAED